MTARVTFQKEGVSYHATTATVNYTTPAGLKRSVKNLIVKWVRNGNLRRYYGEGYIEFVVTSSASGTDIARGSLKI